MEKITKIMSTDDDYPSILNEIYNPPKKLSVKGAIPEGLKVAIVGMRKNTPYGEKFIKRLIPLLVNNGLITVSGLAYGIDTLVHRYTIDAGGKTIAVLGSGINNIYPKQNFTLANQIIQSGGCLISEYEVDAEVEKWHFPERNRIVSGLCFATIVIEAAQKSGSLITAKLALEQGRDVWAVPGSVDSYSCQGTNELIYQGAIPLIDPNTFLDYYQFLGRSEEKRLPKLSKECLILYQLVKKNSGLSVDKLYEVSKLEIAQVNISLTELEINNLIINRNGQIYLL